MKAVEQKPIAGAPPLDPPSADLARQYLDEADAVAHRREAHLDRRGMAVLRLWETIVLAVYLTVFMFAFGAAGGSTPVMLLFVAFFPWIQFSAELRASFGFQARGARDVRRYAWWAAIVVGAFLLALVLQMVWGELPLWMRLAPGLLCVLLLGPAAVREIRQSTRGEPREPVALPRSARLATIALGLLLASTVGIIALGDALTAVIWALLPMLAVLTWAIGRQISARLPELGSLWRWPQWTSYGVSSVLIIVFILLRVHGVQVDTGVAIAGAALIVLLFTGSAFLRGRDV